MTLVIPARRDIAGKRWWVSSWFSTAAAGGLIIAVVVFSWSRSIATPGTYQDGDLAFPLSPAAHWRENYPAWDAAGFPAFPQTAVYNFPLVVMAAVAGWPASTYERALLLLISTIVALAAAAAVCIQAQWLYPAQMVTRAPILSAIVAGCFAVLNPWSLGRIGHLYLLAGFAVSPFTLTLTVLALAHRNPRLAALAGIVHAALGSASPHSAVFVAGAVALAAAYHTAVGFTTAEAPLRGRAAGAATALAAFTLAYVASGAFFWLPLVAWSVLSGTTAPSYLVTQQDLSLLRRYQSLTATVQLVSNWYWASALQPPGPQPLLWKVASFTVPLTLLVSTLLLRPARRLLAFLSILATSATAIAYAATFPLTAPLFARLVSAAPLGWLVREPDKVTGLVVLSYTLGLGTTVSFLPTILRCWFPRSATLRRVSYLLIILNLLILLMIYCLPAIYGVLWSPWTAILPRPVPADYYQAAAILEHEAGARVLVMAGRGPRYWSDGRTVEPILAISISSRSVSNLTPLGGMLSDQVGRLLQEGFDPRQLLRGAGISRIAVEADYPEGTALATRLDALAYPSLYRGDLVRVYAVPGDEPSAPVSPIPAVEVASRMRLIEGLPAQGPSQGEALVVADMATSLDHARPLLGGLGAAEADGAWLDTQGALFIGLLSATLNADPQLGWARGAAQEVTYIRWRTTLERLGLDNWQLDYGLGLLFSLVPAGRSTEAAIALPPHLLPGQYDLWARTFISPTGSWLRLRLEAAPRAFPLRWPVGLVREMPLGMPFDKTLETTGAESTFTWYDLGPFAAESGRSYRLTIGAGPGLNAINAIVLVPASARSAVPPSTIAQSVRPPQVSYRRVSATRYIASVTGATQPFVLILHEHFDRGWIARVRGQSYGPLLVNGISNGFLIDQTGDFDVTLEYTPQHWYDAGIVLSLVSALLLLAWILWPWCQPWVTPKRYPRLPHGKAG